MKKSLLFLLALVAPLHAGELVAAQIPAAAKWMLHADFDAMRASETGKAVFERIEADHGAQLRAFKRMFSVHLINDLHGVTLVGDGKPEHAVLLFNGTFDRAHIEDVLKAADDYSEDSHAGFTILSWKDKGKAQHAAFAAPDLLVFSRQDDLLRYELDVLKANAPASADPFFQAEGGKPLIAASANLAGVELPADAARILKFASVLKIAANENAGRFTIRLAAESRDAAHAKRLRRMLDGVIAFAEAGNEDLGDLDLRCDIAATVDKPGVSAALSLPVQAWITLLKKEADKKSKKH